MLFRIRAQMGGTGAWRPSVLSVQVDGAPTASSVSSGAHCSPPATACRSAACTCVLSECVIHVTFWLDLPCVYSTDALLPGAVGSS